LLSGCGAEQAPSQRPDPPLVHENRAEPASVVIAPKPAKPLPAGIVSIADIPGIVLNLRYKTSDNFMGEDLYKEYSGDYLHEDAAAKLQKAAEILSQTKPGWKLRVLDALRPREIQQKMWDKVKGTASSKYVADPKLGSGHSYGMSVDVTLEDEHGKILDMGTEFDDFTPLAQPRNEGLYLRNGKLSKAQYDNRQLLRRIMKQAGFGSLLQEWWHFNARGIKTIKSRYRVIERAF
jgi:D-alanyl-D-alanine dipeptidase